MLSMEAFSAEDYWHASLCLGPHYKVRMSLYFFGLVGMTLERVLCAP